MNKITVPLTGITRDTDDAISTDGECVELINAKVSNGSVEPVGRPILLQRFQHGREPVFIHKNSGYEHYISYDGNSVYYDYNVEGGAFVYIGKDICDIDNLSKIESVGNTLVIVGEDGTRYAFYANGKYQYLGEKPDMPVLDISYSSSPTGQRESEEIWCDIDPRIRVQEGEVALNDNSKSLVNSSIKGSLSKFLNTLKDDKLFIYPFMVRYALRLFDGSHIMHSAPIFLRPDGVPVKIVTTKCAVTKDGSKGYLTDFSYKLQCDPGGLSVKYDLYKLSAWKDIISSVDIFISKPIATIDTVKDIESFTFSGPSYVGFNFKGLSSQETIKKIEDVTTFYKVKSIPLDSLATSLSEDLIGKVSDIDNLEQQERLGDDAFTRNTITGNTYVFNNRLHVGNIKMRLAPMYPIDMFVKKDSLTLTCDTEIHVATDSGVKVIHGKTPLSGLLFSPYLSYPDVRACKLVLYNIVYFGVSHYREFKLKPHSALNMAYTFESYDWYGIESFVKGDYDPFPEDNTEITPNKIKVSEINNPFSFPARQTYTISNRGIIGMGAATAALSTGQFGQFPLYVFTEEGIFALATGSGEITYTNSFPVSRDCCDNKRSIVSTDNGMVFSTDAGLMALSGSTVNRISDNMDGYLSSFLDSSPVIGRVADVAGLKAHLTTTEFKYYLANADIGFNYEDKEIIVSNGNYPYSYVYGIRTGQWHKISVRVRSFINSYPECLACLDDGGLYNMSNHHRTINDILIVTRPIKLGSLTHKRILQSALRGVIKPSLSDVYMRGEPVQLKGEDVRIFSEAGFYVLGSNDAEHFNLLSGVEKINDIRDLITKTNKTRAYKYFMFCLVGGVRTDVAINYMEALVDETFQNRLR